MGAPKGPPSPPNVRRAPAEPWRSSINHGGPEMAPKPPNVRRAPAEPWRSSINHGGPEMAPKPPKRSTRAGGAVALLYKSWGPRDGPHAPQPLRPRRRAPP